MKKEAAPESHSPSLGKPREGAPHPKTKPGCCSSPIPLPCALCPPTLTNTPLQSHHSSWITLSDISWTPHLPAPYPPSPTLAAPIAPNPHTHPQPQQRPHCPTPQKPQALTPKSPTRPQTCQPPLHPRAPHPRTCPLPSALPPYTLSAPSAPQSPHTCSPPTPAAPQPPHLAPEQPRPGWRRGRRA